MSLPNRDNPYSFDEYLRWRRDVDYYADDPFLQKVLRAYAGGAFEAADREARSVSRKASFRWRDLSERIAWPENRPYMMHFDGHNHRIDRIVRPAELEAMEREVFGERLFADSTDPWVKLIKMFLIYQNGEAGIACPLTCTEGLVELLKKHAVSPELLTILRHCQEGLDGSIAIGAQYLSEIQGGSDVPANLLEAVPESSQRAGSGDAFRLYGKKFFCSATHADYAVVTAKPTGSEKVGLFVVPSWLPGDKAREVRNGYTIDRLKWKLGTCELPTAEITFDGALAYPVGPLASGLANVVGVVLTCSRLTVGLSGAAGMTRGVREARRYAEFRTAFGLPLAQFPLVAGQLAEMQTLAERSTAAAFRMYRDYLAMDGELSLSRDEPLATKKRRFQVRELVMLQKITNAWDSTDVSRMAMSIFGGHGVMEDFSSLPRLFRDAVINEQWEGPRNVLLTQIHRDLQKAAEWYAPAELVADVLAGAPAPKVQALQAELTELVSHPSLFGLDAETIEICRRWDALCHRFFHAYQDVARAEVNAISA
ncbi:MAG: acyl-CoA dehydrogenase family protein [Deltaproteobacteria bacterium]|nr:acyl-CoA dehydrogenase family protein [Deltaproteobacteria bacterium]